MTLADFLLARIAEDETAARAVSPSPYVTDVFSDRFYSFESDFNYRDSEFVDRFSPPRALAECEAKRGIVGLAREQPQTFAEALRWLTLPYADHPDFKEDWRP